jgi:hypothetical protein
MHLETWLKLIWLGVWITSILVAWIISLRGDE